ncbi:hypothetical protein ASC94_06210 [Massilia sp. Root418]|uniref:hypothetical protein n=1 Tax=Massilia sp. Root418 TaxID=1736532 RepID=UPI0006F72BEA|nr:hypothetical protein [Massilia sp. Root418]KQW96441.1 hypothetical protein ASC94_06210 [Massilia sp. Root418]
MAVSAIPSVSSSPAQQASVVADQRAEQARQLRREEATRREQALASTEQQTQQARQAGRAEQERQTQQADAVRRQQLDAQQVSQGSTSPGARIGQNINTSA